MPIYEFYSPDMNRIYSFFARSLSQGTRIPRCPDRPDARMERMVSRFAVTGRSKEPDHAGDNAIDPRMETMMAEMQREMSGLDEKNPDPRALGRLMRKMTEAAGQKMPAEMEQMIQRLEAGDDPENLEEEFGKALDQMDLPDEPADADGKTPSKPRLRAPSRDPELYEMSDFI